MKKRSFFILLTVTVVFLFGLTLDLWGNVTFIDDFSVNRRDSYLRVDHWQSPGETAWNIVNEELRIINDSPAGTTAFLLAGIQLDTVEHYSQISFRFDDDGPSNGRAAGLYLVEGYEIDEEDETKALVFGHLEIRMIIQSSGAGNRFRIGGDTYHDFTTDPNENWTTLRVEITEINDGEATYSVEMTGRYNFETEITRNSVQFAGPVKYNGDGTNVRQDDFELFGTLLGGDDPPLPVELSSFTAATTANMFVELMWVAETETNMLGYRVYRGHSAELDEASIINPEIIPAVNSSTAHQYSYTDKDVAAGETYYYWLQSLDLDLTANFHGPVSITIAEDEIDIPDPVYVTHLRKNYPNPFNPETIISYSLHEDAPLQLLIYNIRGQLVRTLVKEATHPKGEFQVIWDGVNDFGKPVISGVYFYRMITPGYDKAQKMLLLK